MNREEFMIIDEIKSKEGIPDVYNPHTGILETARH